MTEHDLSSGLKKKRESIVDKRPKQPFWSENLLFTLYDPDCDIGLWLHLGTVPTDWQLWEDRVLMMLPGERVGFMCGYHRTPKQKRAAASCLAFECLEPYRCWRITFDGFIQPVSNGEMAEGRARHGRQQRLRLDLEVECATPVWEAHQAAELGAGRSAMASQGWAREHYEQLVRAQGRVLLEDAEYDYRGTGWRDHSCGTRGGGSGVPWGGHVIQGCLFPSGRGIGLSRYWTPDGLISLEGGYVVDEHGKLHNAEVLDAGRLLTLELAGETLPIHLRWEGGEVRLTGTTQRSLWASMPHGLAVGADLSGPGLIYALNFATVSWDGETGWLYSERSDMLNKPAPALRVAPSRCQSEG